MRISRYRRLSLALASLALLWSVSGVSTAYAQLNLVYVESNIGCAGSNMNSVIAFTNDGAGNLTQVSGSPFLTNGTGWCDPPPAMTTTQFDTDQELVVSPDGSLLFAVNAHTNTVASFTINSDGSLTPAAGSPFASNGTDPLSLGFASGILTGGASELTVVNKANDKNQVNGSPNVTTFSVSSSGVLTPVAGSTINLANNSSPAQALTVKAAHLVFLPVFGSSSMNSYRIKGNGTLSLLNTVNTPVTGAPLLGLAQNPVQKVLYAGLPTVPQIAVYNWDLSTGTMTFVRVVNNKGKLPCWFTINKAGSLLFSGETGTNSVSVYSLKYANFPQFLQNLKLASGGNVGPSNLQLDPTEHFLYVLTGNMLHVLTLTGGTLAEPNPPVSLNLPTGEVAIGMATLRK